MEAVILTVHLLVALAMIGVILLQPSEGGALGMGGGGGGGLQGLMTGRGATSALSRTTILFGAIFFATSFGLTLYAKATRSGAPISPISQPTGPVGPLLPSRTPIPAGDGPLLPGAAPATPPATAPVSPAAPAPSAATPPPSAPAIPAPAPAAPPVRGR